MNKMALIGFLCHASIGVAAFSEEMDVHHSPAPHAKIPQSLQESIQAAANTFTHRRIEQHIDFDHLPLAGPPSSHRNAMLDAIRSGAARSQLSSDKQRGPSAAEQEKIRQKFSDVKAITFSDLCRHGVIQPKQSSRYDSTLVRLKSVMMWVQERSGDAGPIFIGHTFNPPRYTMDAQRLRHGKSNPQFGRFKDRLPTLDGWSDHGDNQRILQDFVDHRRRLNGVFSALLPHRREGVMASGAHLKNDDNNSPQIIRTSLFDHQPIAQWRASMAQRQPIRPEREVFQRQFDGLRQYYHYVDPNASHAIPPKFFPENAYVFLGDVLPTLASSDLYNKMSRTLDDHPMYDTPKYPGKSVQADPKLFVHQQLLKTLKESDWPHIRAKDVVTWFFPIGFTNASIKLEMQSYEKWWNSLNFLQKLSYGHWRVSDIMAGRPWNL